VKLVYVCSPGNPTGAVMDLDEWRTLFALADRHGFIIASDECYSEIYHDESAPPLGALAVCRQLGRTDYRGVVVFSSLSKRSNVPGMRSGFVAGDAALLARFLRYRTYHGCAMSPMFQQASIAAWNDEAHVVDNRRLYRQKFDAVLPILHPAGPALPTPAQPAAARPRPTPPRSATSSARPSMPIWPARNWRAAPGRASPAQLTSSVPARRIRRASARAFRPSPMASCTSGTPSRSA